MKVYELLALNRELIERMCAAGVSAVCGFVQGLFADARGGRQGVVYRCGACGALRCERAEGLRFAEAFRERLHGVCSVIACVLRFCVAGRCYLCGELKKEQYEQIS